MKILQSVENFVFKSPAWKLILVIFAMMLFKTGIWYIPTIHMSQAIAQNPFANPISDPGFQYVYWSWLGPFLAWLIGAKSEWTFFMFYFAFSMAFSLLFIKIVFSRFSDQTARTSLILFTILPVSATAYYWVGSDSITLFIMLFALAFPKQAVATILAGIALGMQHFEQGFFAAAGLLFAIALSKKFGDELGYSVKFCLLLLVGVIIGKLILVGIFKYYAVEINSGRIYYAGKHWHSLLHQFLFRFHYIVWSVLGLGWLVALRYLDWGRKTIPFFLSLFGLMLLLAVSGDQTRVLAIIIFLLVSVYWLFNEKFLEQITKKEVSGIFLAWALVPWSWVWRTPKWSVFPYDIVYLLHRMFGWFDIPADPTIWPCG